jgi:hypothetical protein
MARSSFILLALVICVGCQPGESVTEPSSSPQLPSALVDALPGGGGTPSAEQSERVKAEVGVGKKGRSLDNEEGVGAMIVEPARQLFRFKQKAVFDFQIPQALQLFKANEGRLPNSDDEFMTKIVRANNIQLPELPSGQRYVWDPAEGELMVEKPQS